MNHKGKTFAFGLPLSIKLNELVESVFLQSIEQVWVGCNIHTTDVQNSRSQISATPNPKPCTLNETWNMQHNVKSGHNRNLPE